MARERRRACYSCVTIKRMWRVHKRYVVSWRCIDHDSDDEQKGDNREYMFDWVVFSRVWVYFAFLWLFMLFFFVCQYLKNHLNGGMDTNLPVVWCDREEYSTSVLTHTFMVFSQKLVSQTCHGLFFVFWAKPTFWPIQRYTKLPVLCSGPAECLPRVRALDRTCFVRGHGDVA